MPDTTKYNQILDALQTLMVSKNMQTITVSEIAQTAGIGKGSIYYYFSSKEAVLEALIERNYKKPLNTAKDLAKRTDIPPFTRMAMILQACRNSSSEYLDQDKTQSAVSMQEQAYLHQKLLDLHLRAQKPGGEQDI